MTDDDIGRDLSELVLPSDPYLAYWVRTLLPLQGLVPYHKFQEQNVWVHAYLPNFSHFHTKTVVPEHRLLKFFGRVVGWILNLFGDRLENYLARKQKDRIEHSRKKLKNQFGIVVSDYMLKFHDEDRREEIASKFSERVARSR
jgi:hypothetical protein